MPESKPSKKAEEPQTSSTSGTPASPEPATPEAVTATPKSATKSTTPATSSAPAKAVLPGKGSKASKAAKPVKAAKEPKKPSVGNPRWLVPTMLTLFIVGVLWVVTFYLTSGGLRLPIPALGQWNIAAGFALILVGFGLSTRWK